jgi:beta-glucosidase
MTARRSSAWPVPAAFVLLGLAAAACGQAEPASTATNPQPRDEQYWHALHKQFLDRAAKKDVDLLFLGDSITQGWFENPTWKRHFAVRRAANFGIGGDRTQHVLWRLDHGEVDGLSPKVVVLMIGTNNIGSNTPEEIARGVEAIIKRLREKLPKTQILLLGVFPRGASREKDLQSVAVDPRPGEINKLFEKLDAMPQVTYLDISKSFLDDEGKITRAVMPDFLHLSDEGYRRWAEAMEPVLWNLLEAGT